MQLNRIWTAALVGVSLICACSFIADTETTQCRDTKDCTAKGPAFVGLVCGPAGVCVSEGGCQTNAECIDANGGKPFICNKAQRTCVNLEADLATLPDSGTATAPAPCKVYAGEGSLDIRNDDTQWIGMIVDTTSPLGLVGGRHYVNFAELARREIATKNNGIPAATVNGKNRPLAFVHCESNGTQEAAVRAANYLVDKAGIELFIAGEQATTAVPMVTQVFKPKEKLNMGLVYGGVADIPTGSPPLYYAMLPDISATPNIFAPVLAALEQEIRVRFNMTPTDQVRYLAISNDDPVGISLLQIVEPKIKMNGKGITDNGANYTKVIYKRNATPAEYEAKIAEIVAFKPHLIGGGGGPEMSEVIIPAVDRAVEASTGRGPFWWISNFMITQKLFDEASERPELQSRFRSSGNYYDTPDAKLKLNDYKSAFPNAGTVDLSLIGYVMIPYDLMYLYAYAIAGNGSAPVTGANIAKAVPKLFTKGATEVIAGPTDLFKGFDAIGSGSIFLRGQQAFRGGADRVELDLARAKHGYWPSPLYCPLSNEAGPSLPGVPATKMVALQLSGLSFSYPDYSNAEGSILPKCNYYPK